MQIATWTRLKNEEICVLKHDEISLHFKCLVDCCIESSCRTGAAQPLTAWQDPTIAAKSLLKATHLPHNVVSFQHKNLHFLLRNLHFLSKILDFLYKTHSAMPSYVTIVSFLMPAVFHRK